MYCGFRQASGFVYIFLVGKFYWMCQNHVAALLWPVNSPGTPAMVAEGQPWTMVGLTFQQSVYRWAQSWGLQGGKCCNSLYPVVLEPRICIKGSKKVSSRWGPLSWQEIMLVRSTAWAWILALPLVSCVTLASYLASLCLHLYIYKKGMKLVFTS